jgi:hypothetical protein
LKFIERAKEPGPLIAGVRIDEAETVLSELERFHELIMGWGVNQYAILSKANRWNEALAILDKIENKIRELKRTTYA